MATRPDATVIPMPPWNSTNGQTTPINGVNRPRKEPAASPTTTDAAAPKTATDKVMASTANLAQLLPTGTVLAYQALSPSFTNHGICNAAANQWLTAVLVAVLATLAVLFSFTDSVIGRDHKLYYGMATPRGFNVFNLSRKEEKAMGLPQKDLKKLRLRPTDFVHAFFTAIVFLTLVFSDVGLQNCFFQKPSDNTKELLKNLPLGMAFLSSFVFMIFPTKRKGIGYNDTTPHRKASS
uniref:Uncharacterized protein n=1 Tax=Leersia perrieri TaxID=77586 RepID=A0A0D9V198_9ORYZ